MKGPFSIVKLMLKSQPIKRKHTSGLRWDLFLFFSPAPIFFPLKVTRFTSSCAETISAKMTAVIFSKERQKPTVSPAHLHIHILIHIHVASVCLSIISDDSQQLRWWRDSGWEKLSCAYTCLSCQLRTFSGLMGDKSHKISDDSVHLETKVAIFVLHFQLLRFDFIFSQTNSKTWNDLDTSTFFIKC